MTETQEFHPQMADRLVSELKGIIDLIPENKEICKNIALRTKRVAVMRIFFRTVLGGEFDWEYKVKKKIIKKFFEHHKLSEFFNRYVTDHYEMLIVAFEHLTSCTSEEVLLRRFELEPQICEVIPQIVVQNREEIEHVILFCRYAITTELQASEDYQHEIGARIADFFLRLQEYFFQQTSVLMPV